MEKVKIKVLNEQLEKPKVATIGEWIDLRLSGIKKHSSIKELNDKNFIDSEGVTYGKGDILLIKLGIATELPAGYEAIVAPRSSTFKNYGFILTNSIGVIDNTYRGEWLAMVYCTRDGMINCNERFLQFRIQKQQEIEIEIVNELSETERGSGGYGSTGVK